MIFDLKLKFDLNCESRDSSGRRAGYQIPFPTSVWQGILDTQPSSTRFGLEEFRHARRN